MIKTSGHRVSPEEIERAVESLKVIEHAIVFGHEHRLLGEEIILVCINKKDCKLLSSIEVKQFLQKKLASYMIPHHILFHNAFEVTAGNQGKVDRTAIKELALMELFPV